MRKKYISIDIEASGPTPANYSMLSFGACLVGDTKTNFYRELKPLNENFTLEAMVVGCQGLNCLKEVKHLDEYNPKSKYFQPKLVLKKLSEVGVEPRKAILEFKDWVISSTKGYKPVIAATPTAFDAMFIHFYFDKFDIKNPFVFGGEDIESVYRGLVKNLDAHIESSDIYPRKIPHNALEDAIIQAEVFEKILEMIGRK